MFSRKDAADAEHFYLAALGANMVPVAGPIVAAGMSILWDGIFQPLARVATGAIGKVSPRTAGRQILNDWRQVYIDLAGVWWGSWKRPDPPRPP
jgi:hypothetical protein